jgi:hypothetical protein
MPRRPERNDATNAENAVTSSVPDGVGMRCPLYRW